MSRHRRRRGSVPPFVLIMLGIGAGVVATVALTQSLALPASPNLRSPSARDSAEALAVFRENIDAIHKRDHDRYLATYAQLPTLTRIGLRDVETGWAGWSARTSASWPDTLIANDLRVWPLARGLVYARYRYIGVNRGVASTGISERVLVKTRNGWRILVTGSYPDTLPPPALTR